MIVLAFTACLAIGQGASNCKDYQIPLEHVNQMQCQMGFTAQSEMQKKLDESMRWRIAYVSRYKCIPYEQSTFANSKI